MRDRAVALALAGSLMFTAGAGIACDKEDKKDVEEVGNDIDNEVDQLDSDGKDD